MKTKKSREPFAPKLAPGMHFLPSVRSRLHFGQLHKLLRDYPFLIDSIRGCPRFNRHSRDNSCSP
ncbi:MAG: hypothetical protein JXB29_01245, partial [Sedimentisphaerales bacterium]|nr:hypothetical protein [Sedimentisphaerales bacterium]